jgi:NitT/TauT family transport system permease protein
MMSMSGGWFFVVASEAISVGSLNIALPGVGSYVARAIEQRDLAAIGWAILTMTVTIALYDQLLFRPLVAWADKFRYEQTAAAVVPRSWLIDLFRHTRVLRAAGESIGAAAQAAARARLSFGSWLRPFSGPILPARLVRRRLARFRRARIRLRGLCVLSIGQRQLVIGRSP